MSSLPFPEDSSLESQTVEAIAHPGGTLGGACSGGPRARGLEQANWHFTHD